MDKFRDMQEQGTFHAGREYERDILTKRIKELKVENEKLKETIEYALGCGIMTETVCKQFEKVLKIK